MTTFFRFGDEKREVTSATAEVDMHLTETCRDIECLLKFPRIFKLYVP